MPEPDFPMPPGYVWQYRVLIWLQQVDSHQWVRVAKALSLLGMEGFYLVVLPVLFWAVDRRMGLRVVYVFLCSMYVNAWLKDVLHVLRPIGVPGITSRFVNSATGYSMPSGHAQGTMTFCWLIARWLRRWWVWALGMTLVFAIGIARLYLGLHWPMDVFTAWGLGMVFAAGGWAAGRWWTYRSYPFTVRMSLAIALPLILLVLHQGRDSAEYAALLLGIGPGAVLEERYLGTGMDPAVWKRICAAVIGIAGMIAIQWLLKWTSGYLLGVLLRDALIGLWGTLGAPYCFARCGLYRSRSAA